MNGTDATRIEPARATPALIRVAPWALYALAAASVAAAVLVDLIRPDATVGFGVHQTTLVLVAFAALVGGLELATPAGRARLGDASTALTRENLLAAGRYATVLGQLVLLLLVLQAFRIESPAFYEKIFVLTVVGFAIHELIPARHRLGFFALISLSGINLVFGFAAGAWLVGIGLGLIAICHLPIAFGMRITLLIAVGTGLALLRADRLPGPVPGAIWPILGSMFMFRLIVYLYDLRHSKEPVDWKRTLAYFFMLPNVVFPLFPVVDWTMFRRTYYDQERYAIYQRGVSWMLRGITHLLLYRVVDQYFALSPSDVQHAGDFARFLVANYLLYLRVSGQFHLIVGMLHLFGFRLPETHHLFFLASSFTDFWRRINIYWKDFMMKVVYYPAFFALRKRGTLLAIVLATLAVFFTTWLLHAYQWFWLLGTVLLSWPDVLFWTVLAVLLVGNTIIETRRGRTRSLAGHDRAPAAVAARAGRTLAFFCVMCVLWSLWSSESVGEWLGLWSAVARAPTGGGSELALLVVIGAVAVHTPRLGARRPKRTARSFARSAAVCVAVLGVLYAGAFAADRAGAKVRRIAETIVVPTAGTSGFPFTVTDVAPETE